MMLGYHQLTITLVIADLGHWGLIPNGPGRQWPYRLVRAIGDPLKISNFSVCSLISGYFEKVFLTRERLTPKKQLTYLDETT